MLAIVFPNRSWKSRKLLVKLTVAKAIIDRFSVNEKSYYSTI